MCRFDFFPIAQLYEHYSTSTHLALWNCVWMSVYEIGCVCVKRMKQKCISIFVSPQKNNARQNADRSSKTTDINNSSDSKFARDYSEHQAANSYDLLRWYCFYFLHYISYNRYKEEKKAIAFDDMPKSVLPWKTKFGAIK